LLPEEEGQSPKIDIHGPNVLKKFIPVEVINVGSIESDNVSLDVTNGKVRRLKSGSISSDSRNNLKRRLTLHIKGKKGSTMI